MHQEESPVPHCGTMIIVKWFKEVIAAGHVQTDTMSEWSILQWESVAQYSIKQMKSIK